MGLTQSCTIRCISAWYSEICLGLMSVLSDQGAIDMGDRVTTKSNIT